jgi:hypothetical protein
MHCFDTHVSLCRSQLGYRNYPNGRDIDAEIARCLAETDGRYRHANVAFHALTHGSNRFNKKRLHKAERYAARVEIQRELDAMVIDAREEHREEQEHLDDLYWAEQDQLEWEADQRWEAESKELQAEAEKAREVEAAYHEDATGKAVDAHAMHYDSDWDEYVYSLTYDIAHVYVS